MSHVTAEYQVGGQVSVTFSSNNGVLVWGPQRRVQLVTVTSAGWTVWLPQAATDTWIPRGMGSIWVINEGANSFTLRVVGGSQSVISTTQGAICSIVDIGGTDYYVIDHRDMLF